jgi:drug/metabolite transporter (DMT)-like permease
MPPLSKPTLGILIAIFAAFVYGLSPTATRSAYADGANATFIIFIIAMMRAVSFTLFCKITNRPLFETKSHTKIAISNGLFQTISTAGIVLSLAYLSAPVATIILFTYPLILYFLLVFKKQESLNFMTVASVLFTIIGLGLVVNIHTDIPSFTLMGILFAFIAAIATTSRIYVFGNILKSCDAPTIGAESYLFTLICCGILLFYETPIAPETLNGWLWAFLSGLASTIAGFAMFYSIQMIGSFRFSFISKLEPIFAALIAALLIGEVLSVIQYIGIGIVIASLIFYQTQQTKRKF